MGTAQSSELLPGDRIRLSVVAGPQRVVGIAIRATGDSITLERRAGGVLFQRTDSLRLAMDRIAKLEVSRGRSRALGAKRGALILGVGAFALTVTAAGDDRWGAGLAYGTLFGATSAITGALIGAAYPPERWERVR